MTLENEETIKQDETEMIRELTRQQLNLETELIKRIFAEIYDEFIHHSYDEIMTILNGNANNLWMKKEVFHREGIRINEHPGGWHTMYLRSEPLIAWKFEFEGFNPKTSDPTIDYHFYIRSYDDRLNHLQNNPPEI